MPGPNASNEELMLSAVEGNLDAFEEIVGRHHAWAWNTAYRFVGQKEEAEDIVQKAFLRLLDTTAPYRGESLFRTFFYRIITRLCLDQAKKKKPFYSDVTPDIPDERPDAQSKMLVREQSQAVRRALDALPPAQRMAIVLRYYDNLGYQDIAAALDTTPKAAERLLARARERLQVILGDRKDF